MAICRTLGVPARLNPLDGEMQYYGENAFLNVETRKKQKKYVKNSTDPFGIRGRYEMGLYAELDDCEKSETGYLWQTLQLGEGYQGEQNWKWKREHTV